MLLTIRIHIIVVDDNLEQEFDKNIKTESCWLHRTCQKSSHLQICLFQELKLIEFFLYVLSIFS